MLFVLDEVITGFRMAPGGAQEVYGLRPDLSTFAKAMANGAPIGAFVGRRDIMQLLEGGRVRHAGTYNANPLCLAAAKATLDVLRRDGGEVYRTLDRLGARLRAGLQELAGRLDVPVLVQGEGSMLQLYVTRRGRIRTYREAAGTRRDLFSEFAHRMILRGVFVHPDNFEHWFLSAAHTEREVDAVLEAAEDVLREMKREGRFDAAE